MSINNINKHDSIMVKCPCGGHESLREERGLFRVMCRECGRKTRWVNDKAVAMGLWNSRMWQRRFK